MNQRIMAALFAASACLFSVPVVARTVCSNSGEPSLPIDPSLATRIIDWATKAEAKTGLSSMVYPGPSPKKGLPPAQKSMLNLQAVAAEWALDVQNGTVESFYRQAVLHGVNTQYESLMMREDPKNADIHRMWRDTEAARANACLALTQVQ